MRLFNVAQNAALRVKRLLFAYPRRLQRNVYIDRLKKHHHEQTALGQVYSEHPKVSVIIQSFNHKQNIPTIVERYRTIGVEEIIICEDGSVDGSLEEWAKHLVGLNDFIIRSNNLHEIRAYNRALSFALGELICFAQDDDIPPKKPEWFENAMTLFQEFPQLGVLGGYCGFTNLNGDKNGDLIREFPTAPVYKTKTDIPFMFIPAINVGPVFVKRDILIKIGGFNTDFSPVGWPGIHFDVDFSLRTWQSGRQVGWYACPHHRRIGGQSSLMFGNRTKREIQKKSNYAKLVELHGDKIENLWKHADEMNQRLLLRTK